jgi:hypothetical protein
VILLVRDDVQLFFERLKAFESQKTSHIDNDRLIIYAVSVLEEKDIEPTFDNVAVAAFRLFPTRFSLIGFPNYPDAKRVHDCLWHCTYKTKMWLSGNAKSGFALTDKGKHVLSDVRCRLTGEVEVARDFETGPRRKEVFFIGLLKKTSAFKKFAAGNEDEISPMEVREMLRVGNEESKEILCKNIRRFSEYSRRLGAEDIEKFLQFVRAKWRDLFE